MATAADELTRFNLPVRIRTGKANADSIAARLALADRIADLAGTITEDHDATLPCSVDVYLRAPLISIRKRVPDLLLCNIGSDGVRVHGLDDWDRHQVVVRGWGRLLRDGVLLFMPRDTEELEVCWSLLLRAYRSLTDCSAKARPARTMWDGDLPRFSRTTLQ